MDDERPLFTPYRARYRVGDRLCVIQGAELDSVYARWMRLIEWEGIPVDWCPPKAFLQTLAGVSLQVERVVFFHGGVPLYILRYAQDGEEYCIRLCETLLAPFPAGGAVH